MNLSKLKFWKKKETKEYPFEYWEIRSTKIAKDSNINDQFTKVLVKIRNHKIIDKVEYTPEAFKCIKELEKLPMIEEEITNEFDFEQESNFGEVTNKR